MDPSADPAVFPLGLPSRLRPVALLGRGASSAVWQVRDVATGEDLAVKVVARRPGSAVDPARRAETEARALARLGADPGVVRLLEVGRTDDGDAYLVQQLVAGGTLAAHAPVPGPTAAAVGRSVAATLARAHAVGVAHGDLTPDNVVIDSHGRPVLADFGLAGLGFAPDDPGGLTPAFAAPERVGGAPPSAASDVYSLAATLLAVLAAPSSEQGAGPGGGSPAQLRALLDEVRAAPPAGRADAAAFADALGAFALR